MKTLLSVLVATLFLVGCDQEVDRDFFAAKDGIVVGDPQAFERQWILPISFQTSIMHSAIWLGNVDFRIDGRKVFITAVMTNEKKHFANHLDLGFLQDGEYERIYLNTDGAAVPLRTFKIENRYSESERKVREANGVSPK